MTGEGIDNSSGDDDTPSHAGRGGGGGVYTNGGGDGHVCFQCLDLSHFRKALTKLHKVVIDGKGRIEVRRRGCDDVCVLISKAELESLEQALAILAETLAFKTMCEDLTQLVSSCNPPCPQPATA